VAAKASRSEQPPHFKSHHACTAPPPQLSMDGDGGPLYQFSPTELGLGLHVHRSWIVNLCVVSLTAYLIAWSDILIIDLVQTTKVKTRGELLL
jgi:hypothetical protein